MIHTKEYIEISFATQTIYVISVKLKIYVLFFSKENNFAFHIKNKQLSPLKLAFTTENNRRHGKGAAETDTSVIECLLHVYQSDTGLPTLIFVRVGPILSMPCRRTVS
jgi:hypothetical protein